MAAKMRQATSKAIGITHPLQREYYMSGWFV